MKDRISARQLCVSAFTGLLAPAAAVAGLDWRGALLAVPFILLAVGAGSAAASRAGGLPVLLSTVWGKGLSLLYIVWGVFCAGTALAICGQRLSMAAGNGSGAGGMLLAVMIPVLWLAASKTGAFARAGEIFYLAMAVILLGVVLLGIRQVEWRYLWLEGEGIWTSFRTAGGLGCLTVYAVLLWNGKGAGEKRRWLGWTTAGALALALLSALTVGSLSPALSGQSETPFFLMTVGLGQTARAEALAAVLWLLADVTFAALLLHAGRHLCSTVFSVSHEKTVGILLALLSAAVSYGILNWGEPLDYLERFVSTGTLLLGGGVPCILWLVSLRYKKR